MGMKPGGIVTGAQREHPVEGGLLLVRPGTGPGAGGDQQAIEGHPAPIGELHLPVGQIERRSFGTQQPFRRDSSSVGQGGLLLRDPSLLDRFGQGRAIIGFVGFIANQGQLTREDLLFPGTHRMCVYDFPTSWVT
jgi:hypothetical protein